VSLLLIFYKNLKRVGNVHVSVPSLGALLNKRLARKRCGNFAQQHLPSKITFPYEVSTKFSTTISTLVETKFEHNKRRVEMPLFLCNVMNVVKS
jgi:hypothetical protein